MIETTIILKDKSPWPKGKTIEKIIREMEKAQPRDFFGAPGRLVAEARRAESIKLLEEFSQKVYEKERVEGPPDTENDENDPQQKSPR